MKTEYSLECSMCGLYNIENGVILNGEIICEKCIGFKTKDTLNIKEKEGCGKEKVRYSQIENIWKSCGDKFNSGMLILCSECQSKNDALNIEVQNEDK